MRTIILYFAMFAAALVIFRIIDALGADSAPPESTALAVKDVGAAPTKIGALFHVLLTLAAVVALGWGLGKLFRSIGQPPVIGEVVAGIALGPSLLGRVWPEATAFLLPPSAAPLFGLLAQLGIVLYMFLLGLELNPGLLRDRARATALTAHVSMVVPFVLGAALALFLHPRLSSSDVPFTHFALFLGVAMSITAFPVLARILADRGIQTTAFGTLALAAAALGDATAWCLLAVVVSIVQAKVEAGLVVVAMTLAFGAVVIVIVRPLMVRLAAAERPTRGAMTLVLFGMLLSALATEAIGIHALFGAFLFGAIVPHDSSLARELHHRMEHFVTMLLLPAFFAFTGMRTEIGLVSGWDYWLIVLLIIGVATVGKFGGAVMAARACGLPWREANALGVLMNTRGLMELIVLNIGLDLKILSPTLFAMMVLMALATTLATTPILRGIEIASPKQENEPAPITSSAASAPG